GIRDLTVTGVQTCALPISRSINPISRVFKSNGATIIFFAGYPGLKKMMVEPFDLKTRLIGLIERERDNARAGKPARIMAKLNSRSEERRVGKEGRVRC